MQVVTKQSVTYVLEMSEQDLANALVDPAELQNALRTARAAHVQVKTADHTNPMRSSGVSGGAIERAAAKSAKKQADRFLSKHIAKAKIEIIRKPCPQPGCNKQVMDTPKGWGVHNAREHPFLNEETTEPDEPAKTTVVRAGNTFPISVQSVA